MSGTAISYYAHFQKNNQLDLMYDAFEKELHGARNAKALYDFMRTASLHLLMEKIPAYIFDTNLFIMYWGPVIESLLTNLNKMSHFYYF